MPRPRLAAAFVISVQFLSQQAGVASAQVIYSPVSDFSGTTVRAPNGLILASDGNFYGTSQSGDGAGDVFKMTPAGTVTVLHSFSGTDGKSPRAALVEGSDGALYGTTAGDTVISNGSIFKITKGGEFTLLHAIAPYDPVLDCYPEGFQPSAPLLEGADGNFYSTMSNGSNCSGVNSYAFLYRISPTGVFQMLPKPPSGGGYGSFSGLTRGLDGSMYGSTWDAAGSGAGVLFRVTEAGAYTVLHAFSIATEGFFSPGALIQSDDGMLYGTTVAGGEFFTGTIYRFDLGTLTVTTLHAFKGGTPAGGPPRGGLVEGSDGLLYGTTNQGTPTTGGGAIFRINPTTGVLEVLHEFDAGAGGFGPQGELIETSPGVFFGSAGAGGGFFSQGIVFKLTVLPPNLQVAAIKAPATTAPGASITVNRTTRNVGAGGAAATVTRIWLSTNKSLDVDDIELASAGVAPLAAGGKQSASTSVIIPDVAPGAYFLLAQADADDAVQESNEGDNVKGKALGIGADLTITAITFDPASPASAAPTTITLTVKNVGGGTAGPSVTRLYRSANGKVDGTDTLLAELPLAEISAGGTETQSRSLTLPAGTYNLIAVSDARNDIVEIKETNNSKKIQKTIP